MKNYRQRFTVSRFINPATGTTSWRVSGIRRNGERVRLNFAEAREADQKRVELEAEFFSREGQSDLKKTRLTDGQIILAETAFNLLDADEDILPAIRHWMTVGKLTHTAESPRLDEALTAFSTWLDAAPLRDRSKANLRLRVTNFANGVPNVRVADITPDVVNDYLASRNVTIATRDNDRRCIHRFFSWCRTVKKWAAANPCHREKGELRLRGEKPITKAPAILTVAECEKFMRRAETYRKGRLVPYCAVCLFGALRPFEATRLNWSQVQLADGKMRLEADQTKTARGRVVELDPTLTAWLEAYKGRMFYPPNWRKDFEALQEQIGYASPAKVKVNPRLKRWPADVLRHTGISHYLQRSGSYAMTADWAGNSETIIRAHYAAKVSKADTDKFYAIMPRRRSKASVKPANIIELAQAAA